MTDGDDPEMAAFQERRRANLKTLAIIGLFAVGGVLLWKCTSMVDRYGLDPGRSASGVVESLEIVIERSGDILVRNCPQSELEDCVARAKVKSREGAPDRVIIRAQPGAPAATITHVRQLVTHYELVPVE